MTTNLQFFQIGNGSVHLHMGTHQPTSPCKTYEVFWRMQAEGCDAIMHTCTPEDFSKNPCLSCRGMLIFMQEQITEALQ